MSSVSILLATYNGGKFLPDLLNSIIEQKYDNWNLFARDDNSSDDTKDILKVYSNKDRRINITLGNERKGTVGNFRYLTQLDELGDYIMFCDQDDVWLPEKIEYSVRELKYMEQKYGYDKACLAFCEKRTVNENLGVIGGINNTDLTVRFSLWDILIRNPIYGCTMIVNKQLLKMAGVIPDYVQTHDYYYALFASCYGRIHYIDKPLILYRQHQNNVTGGSNNFGVLNKLKKIKKTNEKLHNTIMQNYRFCIENKSCEKDELNNYIDIVDKRIMERPIAAYRNGYRTDGLLSTARLYYALITFCKEL